jgi:hypothetical protein
VREDLARHVGEFMPDAALLLSVVPESFSYTLSEMLEIGLPVIATRVGAFAERIRDGRDGLLVAPDPDAVVAAVERLGRDGDLLAALQRAVLSRPARTAAQMVADYHALLPLARSAGADDTQCALQVSIALALSIRAAKERKRLEDAGHRLRASLIEAQDHGRELGGQLAAAHRRCGEAEGRASRAVADGEAMRRSHSWQLTAPLRKVASLLRSLVGSAPPRAGDGLHAEEDASLVNQTGAPRIVLSDDAEVRVPARHKLREQLAIPGCSRIVLGWSSGADRAFAAHFLDLAAGFNAARNDVFFLLCGVTGGRSGHGGSANRVDGRNTQAVCRAIRRVGGRHPAWRRCCPSGRERSASEYPDCRVVARRTESIGYCAAERRQNGGRDRDAERCFTRCACRRGTSAQYAARSVRPGEGVKNRRKPLVSPVPKSAAVDQSAVGGCLRPVSATHPLIALSGLAAFFCGDRGALPASALPDGGL